MGVLMVNLEVISIRDRQNFFALLVQFEANGVTDIKVIRQRLHTSIYHTSHYGKIKRQKPIVLERQIGPQPQVEVCPSCSKGFMKVIDGYALCAKIDLRTRKDVAGCGFSQLI